MIQVAFLKTKKYTPDTTVLNLLGELKKAENGDYESWIHDGVEYPIHAIVMNRDYADGYNVYIKEDIYNLVNNVG